MTTTTSSMSTPNRNAADPLHRLYATPTNATKQQRWLVNEELEKRTQRRGSTPSSSSNDPLHRLYSTPTSATKNQNWKAHQDTKQKEKESLVWGVDNAKVEHLKQKLAAPLSEQLESQIQNATMKNQKFLKDEKKVKSNNGIEVWGVDKTAIAKAERLKKNMAPISENLENHIQNATSQQRNILKNQRKKEQSSTIKVWGVDKNALAKAERLKQRLASPSEQLESHIQSATSRQRQILDEQKDKAKEKTLDIWGVDESAIAQANRLKSNVVPPSVATRGKGKGKGKFRAASMAVRTMTKSKTIASKKKTTAKTTKSITSPARVSARKRLSPKKTKKQQQQPKTPDTKDLFGDVLDAILNDDEATDEDKNDLVEEKQLHETEDVDTEALFIATTATDKILEATSTTQSNPAVDATSKVNEIQNTVDEIRDALNEIRNAVNESNALTDKNANADSRPPEVIVVKHNHEEADTVVTAGLTLDDSVKGGVEEIKEEEPTTGKEVEEPLMLVEEEEEDQIFNDDEEESEFEDENIKNIPTAILSSKTSGSYSEAKGSVIDSIESKFNDSVLTHQPELLQSWSNSIPPPPRTVGSIVVSSPHASPIIHLKQKPSNLLLSCSVPTSDDEDEDDYDDIITAEKQQNNINKKKKKTKNPLKKLWKKVQ